MSENSKTTVTSGTSFSSLLAIAFIVLKLGGWTEVANWSWWWVLSPIWISISIAIILIIGAILSTIWADSM